MRAETLPDIVQTGLSLLSVGLNPSLPSVTAGFYFANPRNRFWTALNASTLLSESVRPGPGSMQKLLEHEGLGFTDLVKRPTRGASELRVPDYRQGAPRLCALIERYQPQYAWFHGKLAYKNFIRYASMGTVGNDWGLQEQRIGDTRIFVTPNPSPANAAFSLSDLVGWYNRLALCLKRTSLTRHGLR
jgi:TDG/mug DNA glycosylase family protein